MGEPDTMKYKVHYMKPASIPRFILGGTVPSQSALAETHVFLREIEAMSHEQVWMKQQAESWSPNGEARALILEKGLQHTSMSIGDVIEDEDGFFVVVDAIGFRSLDP